MTDLSFQGTFQDYSPAETSLFTFLLSSLLQVRALTDLVRKMLTFCFAFTFGLLPVLPGPSQAHPSGQKGNLITSQRPPRVSLVGTSKGEDPSGLETPKRGIKKEFLEGIPQVRAFQGKEL